MDHDANLLGRPTALSEPRWERVFINVAWMIAVCVVCGLATLMWSRVGVIGVPVEVAAAVVVFIPFSLVQVAVGELLPRTWGRRRRLVTALLPLLFPAVIWPVWNWGGVFFLSFVWVWSLFGLIMRLPPPQPES